MGNSSVATEDMNRSIVSDRRIHGGHDGAVTLHWIPRNAVERDCKTERGSLGPDSSTPSMKHLSHLLSVLALSVPAGASVLVVGPTQTFTEIQSAVDAATDGDVVLVKSGTYASFSVRELDLSIVADAGATVNVDGAIRVGGMHASRTLLLSGLRTTGTATTNPLSRFGLYAHDCDGLVLVQDCVLKGGTGQTPCGSRSDGVLLERCEAVVFTRCTIQGASEYVDWNPAAYGTGSSGFGAVFTSSRVALYDSQVTGGNGVMNAEIDCQTGYGYSDSSDGGAGLANTGSFVLASKSTIAGGLGANADPSCPMGVSCTAAGDGGTGLRGTSSPAIAPQLLESTLAGGPRGGAAPCGFTCLGAGYQGHVGQASTHVPSATTLVGTARPFVLPRLARELATVAYAYQGAAGETVAEYTGSEATFRHVPTSKGVAIVRRRGATPVRLAGVIGGGGSLAQSWTIADLGAGVEAQRVFLQPSFIAPDGSSILGTPQAIVLLDSAF